MKCRFIVAAFALLAGTAAPVIAKEISSRKPTKVIYMIGDGMGLATISAASMTARPLHLESFPVVGLAKTTSANSQVTDSAASATALAGGVKTRNGMVGMDPDKKPVESVLIDAQKRGQAVGLVATVTITHATPAGFYGHQPMRKMEEEIALDLLVVKPDVFVGGGMVFFNQRKDGRDLTKELASAGYQVVTTLSELQNVQGGKVAGLLAEKKLPKKVKEEGAERGDMLPVSVERSIQILNQNPKGFFLMVEGSQIDHGAHSNNAEWMVAETLDFDEAIKKAFDFAKADGNTLVIVTADHETGGVTLPSNKENKVEITYSTKGHTGVMVPVFAYGPGSEKFSGVYENTDIPRKIRELFANP